MFFIASQEKKKQTTILKISIGFYFCVWKGVNMDRGFPGGTSGKESAC